MDCNKKTAIIYKIWLVPDFYFSFGGAHQLTLNQVKF